MNKEKSQISNREKEKLKQSLGFTDEEGEIFLKACSNAGNTRKKELDKRAEEVLNGKEGKEWIALEDLM